MPIEAPVISGRPTRFAYIKDYSLAGFLIALLAAVSFLGLTVHIFIIYAAIGLAVLFVVLVEVNRLRNLYYVTESQVIVQRGMVSKDRMSVFMDNISDVSVRQGYFQRFLGYGEVIIGSASGRDYMELKMKIRKPKKLANKIEYLIKDYTKEMK